MLVEPHDGLWGDNVINGEDGFDRLAPHVCFSVELDTLIVGVGEQGETDVWELREQVEFPAPFSVLILTCPEPRCPLPCSEVSPPLDGGYLSFEGEGLCGKWFDSFECTSLSSTRKVASSIKLEEVFIGCVLLVVLMCGEGGQGGGGGE